MTNEKIIVSKADLRKFTIELRRAVAENKAMRQLLRDIYAAANPAFFEDDPAPVRLPPDLEARILKEIQDEKQTA